MHPLSNTREGLIRIPAAVANLTPGLVAKIDSNGKAALAGLSSAPVAGRYVIVVGSVTASLPLVPEACVQCVGFEVVGRPPGHPILARSAPGMMRAGVAPGRRRARLGAQWSGATGASGSR